MKITNAQIFTLVFVVFIFGVTLYGCTGEYIPAGRVDTVIQKRTDTTDTDHNHVLDFNPIDAASPDNIFHDVMYPGF